MMILTLATVVCERPLIGIDIWNKANGGNLVDTINSTFFLLIVRKYYKELTCGIPRK